MSYQITLDRLKESGNFRTIPAHSVADETVDLSSNDYLGIASQPKLTTEFFNLFADGRIPALTSSASRLLARDQEQYYRLEHLLSELYDGKSCLLFNSGYHANTGMLSALASEPKTLIVADKLVHASMIDGMILSKAPFRRFAHNNYDHLETILQKEAGSFERVIIAAEAIYSMDGDSADIDTLIDIKRRHPNTLLYIDEAHSFGVCGPKGLGLCAASSAPDEIDVVIGTFGKAAASAGAFAITSKQLHDYAVNRARSLIFSTALPPLNAAWTIFIIEKLTTMDAERLHLSHLGAYLSDALPGNLPSSHILPVIVGDARRTIEISHALLEEGFKVLPIRTPTVPPGTERLRISLSAALDLDTITRLANTLRTIL